MSSDVSTCRQNCKYEVFWPFSADCQAAAALEAARSALRSLQALEKFVAFAAAAHENVLVLQHRLDDAQNRFRAQIIACDKNGPLPRKFRPWSRRDIPACFAAGRRLPRGRSCPFSRTSRCAWPSRKAPCPDTARRAKLAGENTSSSFAKLIVCSIVSLRLNRQAENERAVNHHAGLMARLGERGAFRPSSRLF